MTLLFLAPEPNYAHTVTLEMRAAAGALACAIVRHVLAVEAAARAVVSLSGVASSLAARVERVEQPDDLPLKQLLRHGSKVMAAHDPELLVRLVRYVWSWAEEEEAMLLAAMLHAVTASESPPHAIYGEVVRTIEFSGDAFRRPRRDARVSRAADKLIFAAAKACAPPARLPHVATPFPSLAPP